MSQLASMLESYLKRTSHMSDRLMATLKKRQTFIRFLLVGILNTIIGMGLMFLLKIGLNWPYWMATFIGNSIGAAVSFFLNRSFTFNSKVSMGKGMIKFIAVILICYLASFSAGRFIASFGIAIPITTVIPADNLAIVIGTGLYTILNYLGQKRFVFNK